MNIVFAQDIDIVEPPPDHKFVSIRLTSRRQGSGCNGIQVEPASGCERGELLWVCGQGLPRFRSMNQQPAQLFARHGEEVALRNVYNDVVVGAVALIGTSASHSNDFVRHFRIGLHFIRCIPRIEQRRIEIGRARDLLYYLSHMRLPPCGPLHKKGHLAGNRRKFSTNFGRAPDAATGIRHADHANRSNLLKRCRHPT